MNETSSSTAPAPAPAVAPPAGHPEAADVTTRTLDPVEHANRAVIDRSTRFPVLFFFGSAIAWLLLGSAAAFLTSLKMTFPDSLFVFPDVEQLTFGRIRPVHTFMVIYGWGAQAGIGVGLWLMARLTRSPLRNVGVVMVAGALWNVAVLAGSIGILFGHSSSIEWLEFPVYISPIFLISYLMIAVWALVMFRFRQIGHVYVSLWYLLVAFLIFPWIYATAILLLHLFPVQGSVQPAINWWYARSFIGLWFTPIGLASAYYMIPKVLGRPIHSYHLSLIGFWTLVIFFGWNGMYHLIGGPLPAWMISVSIVAGVMMIIPVVVVAINHHMTMVGNFDALRWSPTIRFTVFGAMAYTLVSLQGIMMALRSFNQLVSFTQYTVAHAHFGMYAFFTMTMFGAMYYIVPRLVGWEWPSAMLIRMHFWMVAVGILLMVGALGLGGFLQGLALNDERIPFLATMDMTLPFLHTRTVAGIVMTVGHVCFAASFILMVLKVGRAKEKATLLAPETPLTEGSRA